MTMKVILIITTVLSICITLISSYQKSVVVAPLHDKNFDKFLKEHSFVLVMFGVSLCKQCEKLFPDFEFAAHEAIKNEPPIFFGEVDCYNDGMKTCDKELITEFPTLKFFKYRKYSDLFLYRKRENIATFAMRYISPEIEELDTKNEYKSFLNSTTYGLVGFFESDSPLKRSFLKLATILFNRFDFAVTKSKSITDYQRISNGVIVFKPWYMRNEFERDYNIYKGVASVEKLSKFVLRNFHGIVGFRRKENKHEFKYPLLIAFYDFDFSNNFQNSMGFRYEILKVAKKHKGSKLNFAISNWLYWSSLLKRFDLEIQNNTEPIVTIFKDENKRYVMRDAFNADNLNAFIQNYFNNSLACYRKSKTIDDSNQSIIVEVSYENFKEKIIKSEKDVFLEIYDPDCKVSKKFRKHTDQLAEELNGEILVARLDGIGNDIPDVIKVNGFPTFYFLRKGEKVRIHKFYGARNFKNFIKFIAKNSKNKLRKYDRDGIKKNRIVDEL